MGTDGEQWRRLRANAAFAVVCTILMSGAPVSNACPDPCVCKWKGGKQTVECISKGLIALPEGMDTETQVLDVSGNTLQILHRVLFKRLELVNLQRVYMSRCRLGHLDDLTFQGLTNLVELDLSDNMLTTLPVTALSELPALMRLSLARNPIQRVPTAAFRSLKYLMALELSQCEIEFVEDRAFDGLKNLEWLKLDGNALKSIAGSSVLPVSLHGITLHANPWRCDCHLSQLRAWLGQFNIPTSIEPKCESPDRLSGRPIKLVDAIDFACPPEIAQTSNMLDVAYGRNISFLCKVTGDPEPRLAWWHNDQKILDNVNGNETEDESRFYYTTVDKNQEFNEKQSELIIFNVTEKENGTYFCRAENRAGKAQSNFSLFVIPLPTTALPPVHVDYVFTVGGVVAAIVITLLIIVVAVAVRCCCCHRHAHRTHDKGTNISSSNKLKDNNSKPIDQTSSASPRHVQMNVVLPPSVVIKGNGYSDRDNSGADSVDQSPDLINDTTAIKWRDTAVMQGFANAPFPIYDTLRMQAPYFHGQQGPLNTISDTLLQEPHYNPQNGVIPMRDALIYSATPFPGDSNVINAANYLDSDGFPIDYGLPKPAKNFKPASAGGGGGHVRFAEPPSSVRHYENYIVDNQGQLQQHDFLPDRKYPDTYGKLASAEPLPEVRYPSERYPREYDYPVYSGAGANYQDIIIPSPPEAYKNSANEANFDTAFSVHEARYVPGEQQQSSDDVNYGASLKKARLNSSTGDESSGTSTMAEPLSPLQVAVISPTSAAFHASTMLQRQPHVSPDEGYEDEGIDGTEI